MNPISDSRRRRQLFLKTVICIGLIIFLPFYLYADITSRIDYIVYLRNISSENNKKFERNATYIDELNTTVTLNVVEIDSTVKQQNKLAKLAYGFYSATQEHLAAALVNINRLREFRNNNKHVDYIILSNIEPKMELDEDVLLIKYETPPSPTRYYVDCFAKLIFFNLTQYDRIIYMDIDALVLKSLDTLFDLPSVRLASPVAYWEDEPCFTSALMVITPDYKLWLELNSSIEATVAKSKADMDLLNVFFQHKLGTHAKIFPEVLLLPGYFLVLSSHFRDRVHGRDENGILQSVKPFEDIDLLAEQAFIVHFSGGHKPWDMTENDIKSYNSISEYFYKYNMMFKNEYDEIVSMFL